MTFQQVAQLFPLVVAPGVVAYVRRRWPALVAHGYLDGLVVWLAVVLAAVLFSLLIDFAFGVPITMDGFRRGILLGFTSATTHTLATGKGRAAEAPAAEPSVPAVVVDEEKTRVAVSPWPPKPDMDFNQP
jgi:hypothetical protein